MAREKRIETVAVGSVTLEFDPNRIEGDVVIKSVSSSGWPYATFVPVVDLIGAVAKMGNVYMDETSRLLQPYFDENPCRHKRYEDTSWCAEMSCHNYAGKRDKAPGLDSFEPDQLEGDSEDCNIPEHTHTAAQRRRLRTTESVEGLSALGPVTAVPRRLGLSPEEEAEGE